jgi:protein-disulfide isomerase
MCKPFQPLSLVFVVVSSFGLFAVGQTDAQPRQSAPATARDSRPKALATATVSAGITRDQAAAILNELRAIRQLLEMQQHAAPAALARPTPVPDKVKMSIADGWYSLGREDAPVTLIEFADYQCPFCRRFHSETFGQLKKNYIDIGKLRFVSRDLPLDFHPNAQRAAEAARCAGDQDKYWEMRDTLITHSADLSRDAILRYAQALALDASSFQRCLDGEKHKSAIEKDLADAQSLQVSGTPTFILGNTKKATIEGQRLVGALPYAAFDSAIRQLLAAATSQPNVAQGGH